MTDWRDRARCRGADTELFFPGKDSVLPEEAAALCQACPVTRGLPGVGAGASAVRGVGRDYAR